MSQARAWWRNVVSPSWSREHQICGNHDCSCWARLWCLLSEINKHSQLVHDCSHHWEPYLQLICVLRFLHCLIGAPLLAISTSTAAAVRRTMESKATVPCHRNGYDKGSGSSYLFWDALLICFPFAFWHNELLTEDISIRGSRRSISIGRLFGFAAVAIYEYAVL